jgi:hypothetical protein
MRTLAAALVLLAFGPAAAAVAAPTIPRTALLAIDRRAGYRNFLPTRMLPGFVYHGWSDSNGVLRVEFRNKAGVGLVWRVEPMAGSCDAGRQAAYQLGGNKVWWAQGAKEQRAWRCVFDLAGKPVRLVAASAAPPTKLAGVGLGTVAAHAKRY